ncbi:hypothetical protein [Roseobacter sp. HKCCA0434]|uniref:hypothetical protein n=1 Tax=Roseobacter sp. HKCCA0434 TaxID=3079297 RepID=UPI002905E76C|nr:hypothetical protein [Roseobacter sp. HKCCA0434]
MDPTQEVLLYLSAQVNAMTRALGMSADQVQFVILTLGAFVLLMTLVRGNGSRTARRAPRGEASDSAAIKGLRHARMPQD